ncbi:MAG: hypothetical protein BMS9Abin19_1016 [Gammaproteobacteria bacterium]|nr:MAG: hypothetical protein BMS9Abin19_1016 [Gammaproteobacteria bacterium]
MSVCEKCKDKEHCADLPGICLKLPGILAGTVAIALIVFIFNSSL